ncbi:hypothetical protein FNO01nite_30250 [Flavobacterium noncentrifugens]|uniref:Uncharacterized protein n=1 Tax=Flavobacterium noncentrifugens TaxID=1128970 RepID=A0A1G9BSV8_9FLAO|nr:hypothetical protein [Flavobacterium noncentrifugens]GEP52353.1 hypothetical protein FNO01nite_30250 [Flavobacterium noncentrifugens]SDK42473.1 hypothetical protein SAMN04487935_3338 [Flavobacterium noncentrifugens]
MEIEIKLTPDQIGFLAASLSKFEDSKEFQMKLLNNPDRILKSQISIILDIKDIFTEKFKSISKKVNLFDTKKKHKFTFKYHEAYAICVYLTGLINNETVSEIRANAITINLLLDQKL